MIFLVKIMQWTAKVGERGQAVIPKAVRDLLGLEPGDTLLVDVTGDTILLRRRPGSYAQALRGLHGDVWHGVDAADYVDREREGWEG